VARAWQGLVKKGLTIPRNGGKVQEVVVQMMEAHAASHVLPPLVAAMANNNGKLAAAAAQTARQALVLLGPLPTQARQCLVPACIGMFDSSAAAVRAEAVLLTRELLLSLGPSIRPLFDSLREIQRKEVDQIMLLLPPTAGNPSQHAPQRMLRASSQAQSTSNVHAPAVAGHILNQHAQLPPHVAKNSAAAGVEQEMKGDQGDEDEEEDSQAVYLRLPAQDVLGRLPPQWAAKVLSAAKWQDKRDMLDHLIALSSAPRLAPADYSEVPLVSLSRK
jgi:hypothetical protein